MIPRARTGGTGRELTSRASRRTTVSTWPTSSAGKRAFLDATCGRARWISVKMANEDGFIAG